MTELSKKIIEEYQVRKTGKQKKAFREMLMRELAARGIAAHEEAHRDTFRSVNVMIGDADRAEIIFGAHYDTCPRLPFPNFISPLNPLAYYGYQMMVVCLMVAIVLGISAAAKALVSEEAGSAAWFFVYFGFMALLLKGPANPHTMNDNTSGVVTLIELMDRMPEEIRGRCAFIFFDNEEMGLLGSGAFKKAHKRAAKETPMVNLDCVGEGGYLLLAQSKEFRADEKLMEALKNAFGGGGDMLYAEAEKTVYPSDQKKFKKSLAMAALKKGPRVGYYMNRIHTPKDTVLEEENIARITGGMAQLAAEYLKG